MGFVIKNCVGSDSWIIQNVKVNRLVRHNLYNILDTYCKRTNAGYRGKEEVGVLDPDIVGVGMSLLNL